VRTLEASGDDPGEYLHEAKLWLAEIGARLVAGAAQAAVHVRL
jgi:hypothetical protein